jgi:hypothetical protein
MMQRGECFDAMPSHDRALTVDNRLIPQPQLLELDVPTLNWDKPEFSF